MDKQVLTVNEPTDDRILMGYGKLLAEYNRSGTDRSHTALRPAKEANTSCTPCHADFVEAFKAHDAHYHAFETLRRVEKDDDPFCVSCHTTPVPVRNREEPTAGQLIEGVHCKMCHQHAGQHARAPTRNKPLAPDTKLCEACHNENQSPGYGWSAYLPHLSCYKIKNGDNHD